MTKIYKDDQLAYSLPRPQVDHTSAGEFIFFATRSFREVGSLSRELMVGLNPSKIKKRKFAYAFETILFNVICNSLYSEIYGLDIPAAISLRNGSVFSKHFGYRYLKEITDWFVEKGYITLTIGFRSKGRTSGISTKMRATPEFRTLLATYTLEPMRAMTPLVRIKNDLKLGTTGFEDELLRTEEVLTQLNELIKGVDITINKIIETVDQKDLIDHLLSGKGKTSKVKSVKAEKEISLVPDICCFNRVYSERMGQGGRMISGIQHIPRGERYSIKIEGDDTVEIDFSSLHPNICYAQEGKKAPEDCYVIDAAPRSVAKLMLVTALNAANRTAAMRSVRFEAMKDGRDLSEIDLEAAFSELEDLNSGIAHRFYTSAWKELQHLESRVMLEVMGHFSRQGIIALGVHDSAIVKEEYEEELREVMVREFKAVLSTTNTINLGRSDV